MNSEVNNPNTINPVEKNNEENPNQWVPEVLTCENCCKFLAHLWGM